MSELVDDDDPGIADLDCVDLASADVVLLRVKTVIADEESAAASSVTNRSRSRSSRFR